jgi:hypothetical protein
MSGKDDTEARRRRARELREQIADIKEAGQGEAKQEKHAAARRNAPRVRSVSPRTFVERRMRELDHDDGQERG